MSKPKILLTRRWPKEAESKLFNFFDVTFDENDRPLCQEELIDGMKLHDGIACTVTDKIDAMTLSEITSHKCKIIANYGVGVNHIDIKAASQKGILVTNTPDVLTETTAEIAITLILMTGRRASEGERELRTGGWEGWKPTHLLGQSLNNKTLGIVGMGRIGRATAKKAAFGLGMKVAYYNRSPISDLGPFEAQKFDSIRELCACSDFVSLHCASSEDTKHILDSEAIAALSTDAIVINTARGDVLDEEALITALEDGSIGGAGLDVYQNEPNINARLLEAPNTVFLPHLGSATIETRNAMGFRVVQNLESFFTGKKVPDVVV